MPQPRPSTDFNWQSAVSGNVAESCEIFDILCPVGSLGAEHPRMVWVKADVTIPARRFGPMVIASRTVVYRDDRSRSDTQMSGRPWQLVKADTRGREPGDPVYLSTNGKRSFEPVPGHPERMIGRVINIGDANVNNGGTILIDLTNSIQWGRDVQQS